MAYEENFNEHLTPTECRELYKYHEKSGKIDVDNKYKLWPGLILGPDQDTGEMLFGFLDAMEAIWQNQNPPDCSTANYFIAESWYQGFGSEVHVLGVGLAIAVATNRVFLQDPKDFRDWRIKVPHCEKQNKKNSECYYQPWSKCTIEDAYKALAKKVNRTEHLDTPSLGMSWSNDEDQQLLALYLKYGKEGQWDKVAEGMQGRSEVECLQRWKRHVKNRYVMEEHERMMRSNDPLRHEQMNKLQMNMRSVKDIPSKYGVLRFKRLFSDNLKKTNTLDGSQIFDLSEHKDDQVMILGIDPMLIERNFVPAKFHQLLKCSPVKKKYWRFWWRSIASAYFIRPNEVTLQAIAQYRDKMIHNSEGHCISSYIRHGDKSSEMKLVAFQRYQETAEYIWKQKYMFEDLGDVSKQQDYSARYEQIFYFGTETEQIAKQALQWSKSTTARIITTSLTDSVIQGRLKGQIHELEYLSYLVNLENILKCRISICTYLSNFCRVVDELRVTVGGKANRYLAEVNEEICPIGAYCVKKNNLIEQDFKFNELDPRLW